jgi:hypothetical protein
MALSDARFLFLLYKVSPERKMHLLTEVCFYSGVATLSLIGGVAACISPLGVGLFTVGLVMYVNQNKQ